MRLCCQTLACTLCWKSQVHTVPAQTPPCKQYCCWLCSELCAAAAAYMLTESLLGTNLFSLMCRHTFAHSQSSQIGLENGRSQHLEQALQNTTTESGSHAEASKRAGTAYLNMHKAHTFDLTQKTGSFMYMAPEVFTDRMYNEKV